MLAEVLTPTPPPPCPGAPGAESVSTSCHKQQLVESWARRAWLGWRSGLTAAAARQAYARPTPLPPACLEPKPVPPVPTPPPAGPCGPQAQGAGPAVTWLTVCSGTFRGHTSPPRVRAGGSSPLPLCCPSSAETSGPQETGGLIPASGPVSLTDSSSWLNHSEEDHEEQRAASIMVREE